MSLCDDVCSHCFWARLCGQNHEIVWKVRPNWAGAANLDSKADVLLHTPTSKTGGCSCAPTLGAPVTFISDIILGV